MATEEEEGDEEEEEEEEEGSETEPENRSRGNDPENAVSHANRMIGRMFADACKRRETRI